MKHILMNNCTYCKYFNTVKREYGLNGGGIWKDIWQCWINPEPIEITINPEKRFCSKFETKEKDVL